ncbi:hypothetical protein GCM10027614_38680 [Micromonospora vulcania]
MNPVAIYAPNSNYSGIGGREAYKTVAWPIPRSCYNDNVCPHGHLDGASESVVWSGHRRDADDGSSSPDGKLDPGREVIAVAILIGQTCSDGKDVRLWGDAECANLSRLAVRSDQPGHSSAMAAAVPPTIAAAACDDIGTA